MLKKLFKPIHRYIKYSDKLLLLMCIGCSALSILLLYGMIASDMPNVTMRQIKVQYVASAIGIVSAVVVSCIDYHFIAKLWKLYAPLSIALVVLTFFFGLRRGEADDRAWLPLPLGMSLQPAELMKIAFIMTFALHLSLVRERVNSPLQLLLLCIHGAVPILLVRKQGDDGTMLIFIFIFTSMLFASGINWKYIAAVIVSAVALSPLAWNYLLSNDQRKRFLVTYNLESDPLDKGFQQLEGLTALGSGKLWGIGVFAKKHWWTPEIHNDFIFTFIGQSFGLVGCTAVILLLAAIMARFLYNSRHAMDDLGRFICIGVFSMFAFQAILNIGMCLAVLPVIGITLPLISAGGTSVITSYLGIGLALSVTYRSRKPEFDRD